MHPGVKYDRRKEVADLVSSQVLQKTLDELRNITRIDLCVTNTDGVLLVTTFRKPRLMQKASVLLYYPLRTARLYRNIIILKYMTTRMWSIF